ncbi:MAG: hypothetical protein ACREFL_10860 [Stellaceae bacterium]
MSFRTLMASHKRGLALAAILGLGVTTAAVAATPAKADAFFQFGVAVPSLAPVVVARPAPVYSYNYAYSYPYAYPYAYHYAAPRYVVRDRHVDRGWHHDSGWDHGHRR